MDSEKLARLVRVLIKIIIIFIFFNKTIYFVNLEKQGSLK